MYNMMSRWGGWGWNWNTGISLLWPWIFFLAAIDIVLRGIALYYSARKDQKVWFIALLIVSSAGILPLIYLLLNNPKSSRRKR